LFVGGTYILRSRPKSTAASGFFKTIALTVTSLENSCEPQFVAYIRLWFLVHLNQNIRTNMKKSFAIVTALAAVSFFANQALAVGLPPEQVPDAGSTLTLLSLGLAGLAAFSWKRKR